LAGETELLVVDFSEAVHQLPRQGARPKPRREHREDKNRGIGFQERGVMMAIVAYLAFVVVVGYSFLRYR
jgi:hypothetical protein